MSLADALPWTQPLSGSYLQYDSDMQQADRQTVVATEAEDQGLTEPPSAVPVIPAIGVGICAGILGIAPLFIPEMLSLDPYWHLVAFLVYGGITLVLGVVLGGSFGVLCARFRLYRWGSLPLVLLAGVLGGLSASSGFDSLEAVDGFATSGGFGAIGGLVAHHVYCFLGRKNARLGRQIRLSLDGSRRREVLLAIAVVVVAAVPLVSMTSSDNGRELATRQLLSDSLEITELGPIPTEDVDFAVERRPISECNSAAIASARLGNVDRRVEAEEIAQRLEEDGWTVVRRSKEALDGSVVFEVEANQGKEGLEIRFESDEVDYRAVTSTCDNPVNPTTSDLGDSEIDRLDPALLGS